MAVLARWLRRRFPGEGGVPLSDAATCHDARMDDEACCALFGEARGIIDDWAVFGPIVVGDATLWRGIRAWPWCPGDEGWLLLRDGRWQGLRPVSGVLLSTFMEALGGRPLPDELVTGLLANRRAAFTASTFIGFDGQLWAGTERLPRGDFPKLDNVAEDCGSMMDLMAGLWPEEAREAAVRREELGLLSSTLLRRWTTVDVLGDRKPTGADQHVRRTLSLVPPRHILYKSGAFWTAYRLLRPRRWLEGPTWPWMARPVDRQGS